LKAALSKQLDCLEFILTRAADAYETIDAFGKTAEELCEELGYTEVLDVFEKFRNHRRVEVLP
jgi:hypothetical protein